MALSAYFDLALGRARLRAHRVAGRGILRPGNAAPLIETYREAFIAVCPIGFFPFFQRGGLRSGPLHMIGPWPVACFASDIDLRPLRLEVIGAGIVILSQIRRVTIRAHEIPVL